MILIVTSKNNLSNTTREFDKLDNNTPGIFSNLLPFGNKFSKICRIIFNLFSLSCDITNDNIMF